jgi:heme/copper-type cytochrome/quinol oxidase subunit 1
VRRVLPGIVAAFGVVLVFTGVAVFAAANTGPADFGWSSYTPLEPQMPDPFATSTFVSATDRTVLWTTEHLLGAGLVVLGALLLAAVGGWLLGRRGGRRTVPGP